MYGGGAVVEPEEDEAMEEVVEFSERQVHLASGESLSCECKAAPDCSTTCLSISKMAVRLASRSVVCK